MQNPGGTQLKITVVKSQRISREPVACSQTTVAEIDLGNIGLDTAEEGGLAVGQVVHGIQRDVQPGGGVIDGEDVDGLSVVGGRPAGSALSLSLSVPTWRENMDINKEERVSCLR